jgi:hypothetical protein
MNKEYRYSKNIKDIRNYQSVHGNMCDIDNSDVDVKKYIRNVVLDGRDQCYCVEDKSKSEFLRDEVEDYREGMLDFYNKINGTADLPVDPVDKMNDIIMNGSIKNGNNQTIATFYDNLVKSR